MCNGAWISKMPANKVNNVEPEANFRANRNTDFIHRHGAGIIVTTPIKETSVFTDIQTILFVVKAVGLLPIYEQISCYEVGPPNKSSEFYSFFMRGVVHALTVYNLYSGDVFILYRDSDNINRWIEMLLCILTYTATVFICARNSRNLLSIMNDILNVDEEIYTQYGNRMHNNCGFSVKFIVMITISMIYMLALKLYAINEQLSIGTYILILLFNIQTMLSTMFIVFAAVLLRMVKIRLQYLNEILRTYAYTQQRKLHRRGMGLVPSSMTTFPEDSLFVYRIHNKLLRIIKAINEFCSLILVAYMGYSFYTITTTTYNLFVQITTQKVVSLNVLQTCLAWLSLHTSLLALLSASCGNATQQANLTAQILARVYGKSREFQNIIDKFLTKSIKQEVQFTAYGFFVIDNSTLFKIFSAVTTYLVILIQFRQLEESKLEETVQQQ